MRHGNGVVTYYAHLSSTSLDAGTAVSLKRGIGLSGNTGRSTRAHLHYEVKVNGRCVNPSGYMQ